MVVLAIAAAMIPASTSAAGRCGQKVATKVGTVKLVATHISSTRASCARARGIIRAYFLKKLTDHSERCAGRAVNAPFKGCRVGAFVCRSLSEPSHTTGIAPGECVGAGIRVRFRETDFSGG